MALALVVVNTLLFLGLAVYAAVNARRAKAHSVRLLWMLTLLPSGAVVLGGIHRIGLQADLRSWLPAGANELLLSDWQIGQSIVVLALGIFTIWTMRRLVARFSDLEVVVGEMIDRVATVDLDGLILTPREREVLEMIGTSSAIDDKTLAERLRISKDTAHTHVNRILKETKIKDRRDLRVVAFILKTREVSEHETGQHDLDR